VSWFRLLRLRLLPSALCDILCGVALAGGVTLGQGWQVLSLMAGSALLYVSGMVWNDVADAERDRRTGASRPIANGELSRSGAALLAALLMGTGLWVLAKDPYWALALFMALGILVYDFLGSRVPLIGAPLLGLIRAANLFLGVLGMGVDPGLQDLFIPAIYALYIALIVWHGSLEDARDTEVRRASQKIMLCAAPLPLLCAAFLPYGWLTLLAASPQFWLILRFARQPFASTAACTGLLLRGISRFTAAVCLGTGQWLLASLCLALAWLVPAVLGRIRWS
jgi:4-hydroxybenzoate polyprenyltransferase